MSVIRVYGSLVYGAMVGTRSDRGLAFRGVVAFVLVLFSGPWISYGEETNTVPVSPVSIEGTNFEQLVRTCLQIQEQLRATQLALEQNRLEAKAAAAQNAEALSRGLQVLQETFLAERARDLEGMQRSNRFILIVAGTVAALGFLVMLIITCLQWRMSKGLAEISAGLPPAIGVGAGPSTAALGSAQQANLSAGE